MLWVKLVHLVMISVHALQPSDFPRVTRLAEELDSQLQLTWAGLQPTSPAVQMLGLVARDGTQPGQEALGFLVGRRLFEDAEVLWLVTHRSAQRRGIATALLRHFSAQASALGAERLLLEVAADNLAARNLYARFGFRELRTRPRYYSHGADAIELECPLLGREGGPH